MSKLSLIERNKKRIKLYKKYKAKHDKLLKQANNKKLSADEQFKARLKLSKIPRNASKVRIRNRCVLTGRARGVYRKFRLSRIVFRELASIGHIPGITKSSW
ncbi:MAG: 30S ribosomal protein S14 [Rickettsiales bacterium]|nr:30S ribosomal protein S14 [Rickettsiales bacterium]|tara:strand:- start:2236 stop:2541 length:306 start_codon:yes stop_codon:yes gene_type:complete